MPRNRAIGVVAAVLLVVAGIVVVTVDDDDHADRVSADATSSTTADSSSTSTTVDLEKDGADVVIPTGSTAEPTTVTTTAPAPAPTAPPATDAPAPTDPPPPPPTPLGQIPVRLTGIVSLAAPIALAARPGSGELWVAEQGGRVVALRGSVVTTIDISAETEANGEQGLLGMAFDGSGSRLYLSYTDNNGDSHVDEFAVTPAGAVDAGTRRPLLFVDQPYANHNGGNLTLGPDGAIWLGLGDGGSGGDPQGHAQRDGDLLGKLLRHQPGSGGFDIVAKGLRNPWRFSFDRATGDLWLGDVGQGQWEEINAIAFGAVGGANFGWNRREGSHPYQGGASVAGDTDPVHEYDHSRGCSITGGYVYRGAAIPALVGTYLYGDYCEGAVRGLRVGSEDVRLGPAPGNISSFGQDLAGELYVLSLNGGVYRIDPA